MTSLREKYFNDLTTLKDQFGVSNSLAVPRLSKVVINVGTGKAKDLPAQAGKKRNDLVADRLAKITGQKPALKGAKKSIASFKLRQGEVIGLAVTLRGRRMYDFLDRFINIALPRMRDFKGLNEQAIDEMGNLTIGLKEHTIFPETADEDIRDVFGLAVTIVTTAKNKENATKLFRALGFPFKKAK